MTAVGGAFLSAVVGRVIDAFVLASVASTLVAFAACAEGPAGLLERGNGLFCSSCWAVVDWGCSKGVSVQEDLSLGP